MGIGGFEKLILREVPIVAPASGEVLVQVLAAGINNTDINTRIG
jgi:NADPH:quinone reductase-like Zn-dependent oxidoreductase